MQFPNHTCPGKTTLISDSLAEWGGWGWGHLNLGWPRRTHHTTEFFFVWTLPELSQGLPELRQSLPDLPGPPELSCDVFFTCSWMSQLKHLVVRAFLAGNLPNKISKLGVLHERGMEK